MDKSIFQAQYAISTLTTTFCYSHSDTLCCAWQEKMKNKREKKWYYVEAGASCSKGHKQNWIHPSLLRFFKSTACLPSTAVANFATFSPDLATFWEPFSDWTSNKGQATNLVTISVGISYFLAPTQSSPDHISRRLWSWLKHETWTASAKSTLTDLEEYYGVLSLSSFHDLIPQRNYSSVHGKHSVSNIRHSSLDDTWLHTIVLPSENRIQSKLNLNTF